MDPPMSPETKSVPAMAGSGGGGGAAPPADADAAEAMWWMMGARRCAGRSMTAKAAFCASPKRFPSIFTTAPSELSSRRRSRRPSTAETLPCASSDCTRYAPHDQSSPATSKSTAVTWFALGLLTVPGNGVAAPPPFTSTVPLHAPRRS